MDREGLLRRIPRVDTLCRAAGADEHEAAEIANHAAGIVVGKIGTAVTSPGELLTVFRRDGGGA